MLNCWLSYKPFAYLYIKIICDGEKHIRKALLVIMSLIKLYGVF